MALAILATCGIAAAATAGVILRPWRLPEAIWAVAGAGLLVLSGLLPAAAAWTGLAKGADVYLFLAGMMLLAELARAEGLFDWLAGRVAIWSRGSPTRLFNLTYLMGTIVTVFLSNDATAVVLTPAVAAMARAVDAKQPLPYLFIPAFIANAASFVLPISNPANLVIYGSHVPPLLHWLPRFAVPSILAIAATYLGLRLTQRGALRQTIARETEGATLTRAGIATACGIAGTALVLMTVSAFDLKLGLPTALAGITTAALVMTIGRKSPWPILKEISWGVLPLVAGLFVLVEALERIGLIGRLGDALHGAVLRSAGATAWGLGVGLGFACNLTNNLPAGLMAGTAVENAHVPAIVSGAVLIGIDLGPNLSVTGSLATILWLAALRRDEIEVGAWTFFRVGVLIMPPALLLALAGLWLR